MRTLHFLKFWSKGESGFDNNAGHYEFDDAIGKTRHMVVGRHLRFADAGVIYDFAGVIFIRRAA
jgi:hypothetical protein